VPSPSPSPAVGGAGLLSASAISANDAWAVGVWGFGSEGLIQHWNGKTWKD
jgi:hypothetical protein